MSLKLIEMQVALPRTVDAAKIQEQHMQRGQLMNSQANMMVQQDEVKQRTTVVKQEQKEMARFHENGGNTDQQDSKEQKEKQKKNNMPDTHPYKGHFIDFSG